MPASPLSRNGSAFDRIAKTGPLYNSSTVSRPQHLFLNAPSDLWNQKSLPTALSIADRSLFVEDSPKCLTRRGVRWSLDLGLFLKRIMDPVLSAIGLLILWPLMLLIAIAVKLESPGHFIYRSFRVGKSGRTFDCYKFRTMVAGSDSQRENLRRFNQRKGPLFKIADDPRLTRLGGFLRKYSLDELPQLWNVLKGDMSLVGPRPHPIEDCIQYTSEDCRRLAIKPGVTGLWQILARTHPSFDTCLMLDLAYIENWSLLLDFRILLKTIPAVLAGEGQ